MFVFCLFFLYIFGAMLVGEIILTGILHIEFWLEEKRDEKKMSRKEKYSAMFEYMKNN